MKSETLIKELFDSIYLREKHLTLGQVNFIQSLKKQFNKKKELSDKQVSTLKDILRFLPEEVRYSRNGGKYPC